MNANEPTTDELEALFVNNVGLQAIEAHLSHFNPIRVMRMAHMEIRHSAILAWMLDPNETHGLGDYVLKAFLGEALRGAGGGVPSALDVARADLRDAEVRREWRNIDIFVQSPQNGWVFIIENKFHSTQGDGQLSKYKKRVRDDLDAISANKKPISVRGVYLTLREETPQDSEYVAVQYAAICGILQRVLETRSSSMSAEVQTFVRHYLEVLEAEAGMSAERTEMENLARELYRQHKRVLDFVLEHGAGSDFALGARSLFGENPEPLTKIYDVSGRKIHFSGLNNSVLSVVPNEWVEALGGSSSKWPGCEKWWAGLPVIIWIDLRANENSKKHTEYRVRMQAEVGPLGPPARRVALIEAIKKTARDEGLSNIGFQAGATEDSRKYSRFFKKNDISFSDGQDAEVIAKKIADLIKRFGKEIEAVGRALKAFRNAEQVQP